MSVHTQATELDHALLALADPTRRQILEFLAQGEARVTTVAGQFPISLNSVSKHIKLLERGHLIERRIAGREHFLRIRPNSLESIQRWISAQQLFWAASLKAIDDSLSGVTTTNKIKRGAHGRSRRSKS